MYRKELENREGNFNRMFAEKQPVILNSNPEGYLVSFPIFNSIFIVKIKFTCLYSVSQYLQPFLSSNES